LWAPPQAESAAAMIAAGRGADGGALAHRARGSASEVRLVGMAGGTAEACAGRCGRLQWSEWPVW
jgi:hypothetical protein